MTKFIVSFLMVFSHSPLWAGTCSLCRETLRLGGNLNLIRGYYWSIILLVSIPLIVIGFGVRYSWRKYNAGP
jgi:hypothetical protein